MTAAVGGCHLLLVRASCGSHCRFILYQMCDVLKMWYAVANLAKLWQLLAFCDDKVLVRILEVFSFFYRRGSEPMSVSDYF